MTHFSSNNSGCFMLILVRLGSYAWCLMTWYGTTKPVHYWCKQFVIFRHCFFQSGTFILVYMLLVWRCNSLKPWSDSECDLQFKTRSKQWHYTFYLVSNCDPGLRLWLYFYGVRNMRYSLMGGQFLSNIAWSENFTSKTSRNLRSRWWFAPN